MVLLIDRLFVRSVRKDFEKSCKSIGQNSSTTIMNTSNLSGMWNTTDLNQSSIVLESAQHKIASYGSMLPVLMVEAMLTGEQPLRPQSVKITESGWLWLVCGRKLFVWQFRTTSKKTSTTNPCFELELPPSDLVFKADLVTLFSGLSSSAEEGRPAPVALLAVSPEGTIRFWHNIAFESSFLETTVQDLQGQECATLCQLSNRGCLLATTTSSLVFVSIHQNELSFRPLKSPQGMLSGFKKFTSFFGMTSVVPVQEQSVKSFIGLYKDVSSDNDFQIVYALTGSTLQTWTIANKETEALIGEQDLESVLKNSFFHLLPASTDPSSTKILILDAVLPKRKKLEILVALVSDSSERGSQGFLLIAVASYSSRGPDTTSSSFVLDAFTPINDPSNLLHKDKNPSDLRLLLCPSRNTQYIFDDSKLYFIRSGTVVDVLDFEVRDDEICGAGICNSTPLMFTCRDGLVTITPTTIDIPDLSSSQHNVSVNRSIDEGNLGWFRKALHLYTHNQRSDGESLLRNHFNPNSGSSCSELASLIFDFSMLVIDGNEYIDIDDRNRFNKPLGFSSQDISTAKALENKRTSLAVIQSMIEPFEHVLEAVGHRGIPLGLFLTDLIDRVTIVCNIISCYHEFSQILEHILPAVVEKRRPSTSNASIQDFYNESSRVTEILPAIMEFQDANSRSSHLDADEVVQLQITISDLLLVMFTDAVTRRSITDSMLSLFSKKLDNFTPWDASSSHEGFRKSLLTQIDLLLDSGLRLSSTSDHTKQSKQVLFDRYVQLANLILDSYSFQLKFLDRKSSNYSTLKTSFEEVRTRCLKPLMANNLLEKATLLAEKFEDFDILIEVCERSGAEEQLERYRSTFASRGFSAHLGNWYLKNQKPGKVLQMPSSSGPNSVLKGHSELLWIQQFQASDFAGGSQTLKTLAQQENENMSRKKIILSLCKLAALVSDQSAVVAEADQQLYDINSQEAMQT